MDFPALHGNWVDLILILILFIYLVDGWGKGAILGLINLAGFLLSFFAAIRFYDFFGTVLIDNFSLPRGVAKAAGFLLAGVITEAIFSFLVGFVYRKLYLKFFVNLKNKNIKVIFLLLNKLLGIIPALGEALIFISFILTLLIALPIQGAIKRDILSSKLGGPLVARTQGIERQLNKIFGEAVNETLTFLTINPNPASSERVDLGFNQKEGKIDESAENTMFFLVNQEREKQGLSKLKVSQALKDVARKHAKDMFERGYFSHYNPEAESPFDRMEKAGINFISAGENLALAPNVFLAHQGLMNSPGHRANILSADFGKVGIGVIDGGIYGEMVVQEFTD